MKPILCSILLAFSLNGISQNYLTNRQVYDFAIGDVFQTEYQEYTYIGSKPPIYATKTITNKIFSLNGDTITYTINNQTYQPPSCATCPDIRNTFVATEVVTDLDSAVYKENLTPCYLTSDTIIYNSCNTKIWWITSIFDSACSTTSSFSEQYFQGAGGPYYDIITPSSLSVTRKIYSLHYYRKGNTTCGTYNSVGINSIEENKQLIKFYPNPTRGAIKFETSDDFVSFKVYDIIGKICLSGSVNNNAIDISKLIDGTYFIAVYTSRDDIKIMRVEKQ